MFSQASVCPRAGGGGGCALLAGRSALLAKETPRRADPPGRQTPQEGRTPSPAPGNTVNGRASYWNAILVICIFTYVMFLHVSFHSVWGCVSQHAPGQGGCRQGVCGSGGQVGVWTGMFSLSRDGN